MDFKENHESETILNDFAGILLEGCKIPVCLNWVRRLEVAGDRRRGFPIHPGELLAILQNPGELLAILQNILKRAR